ncbi:glutathione-disulfide reductase [Altericroceibacterium endophyticum]|uniref:Glutathione-disulfide reductase n=1 Tax=Altericroceibacterium endophyticum TaxID=1808508 RepID=A0A6I4T4Z3_9SPHN|nr:glutathione-disulfide reductase [Altericroceibacterium endophyticum]MXO64755.1 glutathione-disulfide reductase [Altericroceibacterium endophyticum]
MSDYDYDLFVIGAGSGGVRASRVAASYGAKVAVAEEHRIGGTCVIRGCVPKKLLVYASMFAEELDHAGSMGWDLGELSFNWEKLRDHVNGDVDRLNGLYTQTLDSHKVEQILERATVTGPHSVKLSSGREVTAKYILVAVGAWPYMPDIPGVEHCISSNEVFHLEQLPKRIMVVGAGYIAMEFAGIFNALGCDVDVVNRTQTILRGYDEGITDRLLRLASARGIQFHMDSRLNSVEKMEDGTLCVDIEGRDQRIDTDCVLVATGRVPKTDGLGLETAAVDLGDKGEILVDEHNRTSCDSIYAVGDVTNRVQLTPVAIREGQAFSDTVFGEKPHTVDYDCIPSAVFSQPPMGGVGLTESEARDKFGSVKVYTSDFRPMKNIFAETQERGLYKMICDADTDKVLGIHMIGPETAEILQSAAVAVKAGLTKRDFDATVAIHPSMAEELVLLK